ncbi:MAG: hypothetical protein WEC15_04560 [Flavobacteriales bacterium]
MNASITRVYGSVMARNLTFFFVLLFSAVRLSAQCCCSDILVHVSLEGLANVHSEREFEVLSLDEHHGAHLSDRDSTDQSLLVRMDTGCGLAERRFAITSKTTGERMELSVLFIGFDGVHPDLRVPFRSGTYEVDYERLISCTGANEYLRSANSDTLTHWSTVVPCGPCRVLMEVDINAVVLEPLEMGSGGCAAGRVDPFDPSEAAYPGGQQAFQLEVERLYRLRRPSYRGFPNTLNGIGVVSEQGRFSTRILQPQTDLVYQAERALEELTNWRQASVPNAAGPGSRRPIRSMVRFRLDPSVR